MAPTLRPFHPRSPQDARRELDREFSELRHVQLEIDAFLKRHDGHISASSRKYLDEASLQIEIKLTAMAARAARRARTRPRGMS